MKISRRILSVLLCVFILFGSVPLSGLVGLELPDLGELFETKAEAYTEGIYGYSVSDGKATITGCNSSASGAVTIPSTLGGYPVTSIGSYAFRGCTGLTSVTIGNSVTSIGVKAFSGCASLEYIHLPSSVTSIASSDFLGKTTAYICSDTESCYAKTYAEKYGIIFKLCSGHEIYHAVFIVDGKKYDSVDYTVESGSITEPKVPEKPGYIGEWETYSLEIGGITVRAIYTPIISNAVIRISAEKKFDYRSIITIKANATGVPDGYHLALFINGSKVADGTNTEVSYTYGELVSDLNYTVKIIGEDEIVTKDEDGNNLTKDSKITVNAGFFKKLIAFFKGLFGSLPKIEVKP